MADFGISEAAAIVGTVVAAAGAVSSGIAQSHAADYSAQVAQQNAQLAKQQAQQNAEIQAAQARQQLGATAAAYGASGVTAEGSPLDVLASSAYKAEMDRQTILYDGRIKAMGYEDQ